MGYLFKMDQIIYCLLGVAILIASPSKALSGTSGDLNGDGKTGLEEAIYALQVVVGMKPQPTTYSISGTVNGLLGAGLILQNNGDNDLIVGGNGNFTFANRLDSGANYNITVKNQPSSISQTCIVNNGTGTIAHSNVTNVEVICEITSPGGTFISFPGTTARNGYTATLLNNGKILIAGGAANDDSPVSFASAELYDPATNTWSATGSMTEARAWHTAILLPNGKVLVAGGVDNDNSLSSAELYDPATGVWTATGPLITGRNGAAGMVLLPNGKILIAGGHGGETLSSAELYDPVTGVWNVTGSMSTARRNNTMTLLPNGKVLVAGGTIKYTATVFDSAELYDPATGTWSATGSMTAPRILHTATMLPNGQVLVAGGSSTVNIDILASAELYDPTTGVWTATGSMTTAKTYGAASLLPNGNVLSAGGFDGTNAISKAEIYNPTTATWSATGSMSTGRVNPDIMTLSIGKVLVMCGIGVTTGEFYNPIDNFHAHEGYQRSSNGSVD